MAYDLVLRDRIEKLLAGVSQIEQKNLSRNTKKRGGVVSDNSQMMKGMFLGGLAAFAFVFLFEFGVHGFLMKGMYDATMSVWRPPAESNMVIMLLGQFLFGMAVAFFYPIVGPDRECKKAGPFGFGLGLVMAMPQIATYSYLPIPITISLAWAAAAFVKAFGSAFVVAKVFNKFGG